MSWAQRLKRVFRLDLETCEGCRGQVRVVACIEDPLVIAKIIAHLDRRAGLPGEGQRPEVRGPPSAGLEFGELRRSVAFAGSGPAVRGCAQTLVRGEKLAGRGRFGVRSPGFRQGL